VMEQVTEVMGQSVEYDDPMMEAGLDSRGVSALRVELAKPVGMMMLAASIVFDYPTVNALVSYLETELDAPPSPQPSTSFFSGDLETQKAALRTYVMERVTEVLGCPVEHDAHLMDAGLDSLGVSALRVELAKPVGMVMLAASAFFDYPTLGALVGYLATHLESDSMMPTREESWELVPSPVDMEATAPATELAIDSPSTTPSSPVDESSDSS